MNEGIVNKTQRKKSKITLGKKVLGPALIVSIIVSITILGVYYYYKPPTFDYPKMMNTYEVDAKNNAPDIVVNKLLYSIYNNDPNICREVLGDYFFNDYRVDYYSGIFDDDKVKYLLTRTNEDLTKEYGEGWYDNLIVQGVESEKVDNLVYSIVNISHNGEDFKFSNMAIGFDNQYSLNSSGIRELFDSYMLDDSRRPKNPYKN